MKTIRLYVCTILLIAMAGSVTGCSNTNRIRENPTTGTTRAPGTTQRATEGVIDGLMDDVRNGADDVRNGVDNVRDNVVGTDGTGTTDQDRTTFETTR